MNPYIKQFPDLMAGKKIMYVHGFLSSAQSGTVKMLHNHINLSHSLSNKTRYSLLNPSVGAP